MQGHEQLSFNYDQTPSPSAEPKQEIKIPIEKPVSVELDNECQYCGTPYESDRSCVHCMRNAAKRAYLKGLSK